MAGRPPGSIGLNYHPIIDSGTMCLSESTPPTTLCSHQQITPHDEITPIANYIAKEMNANAHGADVQHMIEMNNFSATACIEDFSKLPLWKQILGLGIRPEQCVNMGLSYRSAALLAWGMKVRQNGDWDHKPKIATRFNPRNPGGKQHWHLYGNTLYFYDVWSNIHYGYVGAAAGFSESVLLDGAGLEQIASSLLDLRLPERSPAVSGLRAWDDSSDRDAITIGIKLYGQHPKRVTGHDVLMRVLTASTTDTRVYSP